MIKYILVSFTFFIGTSAFSETFSFDLISKSNCVTEGNIVKNCKLGPILVTPSFQKNSAVPFKTIIKTSVEGNCKTYDSLSKNIYPLQMSVTDIQPDKSNSITSLFSVLKEQEIDFRTKNRGPVENLDIRDKYPSWTQMAIFSNSCVTKLEITPNHPDINSSEEALAILRPTSERIRENSFSNQIVAELHAFQSALKMLYSVIESSDKNFARESIIQFGKNKNEYLSLFEQIRQSQELHLERTEKRLLSKIEDFIEDIVEDEESPDSSISTFLNESDQKLISDLLAKIEKADSQDLTPSEATTKKLSQLCIEFNETRTLLMSWITDEHSQEFTDVILQCEKLSQD